MKLDVVSPGLVWDQAVNGACSCYYLAGVTGMHVVWVGRLKASEQGDYSFCFDNSFSQFSTKVVYFELFIANGDDDDSDSDALFANLPNYADYEINLEHVKVTYLTLVVLWLLRSE